MAVWLEYGMNHIHTHTVWLCPSAISLFLSHLLLIKRNSKCSGQIFQAYAEVCVCNQWKIFLSLSRSFSFHLCRVILKLPLVRWVRLVATNDTQAGSTFIRLENVSSISWYARNSLRSLSFGIFREMLSAWVYRPIVSTSSNWNVSTSESLSIRLWLTAKSRLGENEPKVNKKVWSLKTPECLSHIMDTPWKIDHYKRAIIRVPIKRSHFISLSLSHSPYFFSTLSIPTYPIQFYRIYVNIDLSHERNLYVL